MALSPAAPPREFARPADPLGSVISEALKALARAVRSFQLYLPNNPMHVRALDSARAALVALWARTDHVELGVTETEFPHDDIPIYSETDRGGESLPWLFYKDGIRSFELRNGFETRELPRFLGALQAVRAQAGGDEDLVTLFWECDFEFFSYKYEEAGGEGCAAPGAELLRGGAPAGAIEASVATRENDVGRTDRARRSSRAWPTSIRRCTSWKSRRSTYLHQSIRRGLLQRSRGHRLRAALLDTFEAQTDPTVREEICGILENFMLVLLSGLQFRTAAFLIRECAAVRRGRGPPSVTSHSDSRAPSIGSASRRRSINFSHALEDTSLKPPHRIWSRCSTN